jgi:hypothetical protein
MNYVLAMMALDGLVRAPLQVTAGGGEVRIQATADAFKELARLCLILGGQGGEEAGGFELQPGRHVSGVALKLELVKS